MVLHKESEKRHEKGGETSNCKLGPQIVPLGGVGGSCGGAGE